MYTYRNKAYDSNKIMFLLGGLFWLFIAGYFFKDYLSAKQILLEGTILKKDVSSERRSVRKIHSISFETDKKLQTININLTSWDKIKIGDYAKAKVILLKNTQNNPDNPNYRKLIRLEVFRDNVKIADYSYNFLFEIIIGFALLMNVLSSIDYLLPTVKIKGLLEEKTAQTPEDTGNNSLSIKELLARKTAPTVENKAVTYLIKVSGKTFAFEQNLDDIKTGGYVSVEYTPISKIAKTLTKELY